MRLKKEAIMHKFIGGVAAICIMGGIVRAQSTQPEGTWNNKGTRSFTVNPSFYPENLTRYVAPGAKITFDVKKIEEQDTRTDICNEDGSAHVEEDSKKEGRLRKTGGAVGGEPWSKTITAYGNQTYTVPADALPGQDIVIVAESHDTRVADDPRHDDWMTHSTWRFVVSTDCPNGMQVVSMTDALGNKPVNPTYKTVGIWEALMEATGNPPAARGTTWNGTTVTETVSPFDGKANEWIDGVIGAQVTSGTTFTFGTAGDNRFKDTHATLSKKLQLSAQTNHASLTATQTYRCSENKSYEFTITKTGDRINAGQANEMIKITYAKAPKAG